MEAVPFIARLLVGHGPELDRVRHIIAPAADADIGRIPHFHPTSAPGRVRRHAGAGTGHAFGQPLESQLRSCLLASWIGEQAGFDSELRDTVYWVALLRYIGCTGHAHEVATVFGDEIAIRAQTLVHDAANPAEVMRDVIAFATAGHEVPPGARLPRIERAGGLSDREVEVLGLAAKGLTTRQIADRLFISPKTADHHIQHVYTKIGVATRAAAALWAMQNDVVR
jgi:DNA-binding CsgD family transcriptional regulator